MNIPKTIHNKVTYRNGQSGLLLTSVREETGFSVLTMREKDFSVIHHLEDGKATLGKALSPWDIVEVEE